MPILSLQTKIRELGRIRLGDRSGNRGAPKRLDTFRFTSAYRPFLDQIAARYGGAVREWESPRGPEWEIVSGASEIDIIIPPESYLVQWMEMWSSGGCQRRCDTQTETIEMRTCLCPSDPAERQALAKQGKACEPISRLWVMLPGIEGMGTWRLETGSWYAAEELQGVTSLLAEATAQNTEIPATLRIEARSSKRNGATLRYSVPVVDARIDIEQLVRGQSMSETSSMVAPPQNGRRATQRVPLAEARALPAEPESMSTEPGHGPPPPVPDSTADESARPSAPAAQSSAMVENHDPPDSPPRNPRRLSGAVKSPGSFEHVGDLMTWATSTYGLRSNDVVRIAQGAIPEGDINTALELRPYVNDQRLIDAITDAVSI